MNKHVEIKSFGFPASGLKSLISIQTKDNRLLFYFGKIAFFLLVIIFAFLVVPGQNVSSYFSPGQPTNNYLMNSSAFRQEIVRLEINVVRQGKDPLPLIQVPRLEKDDVLKVHLLDEQVNGMKPDQSNWNWTLVVAYINPARNNEKEKSVSEEIQFRKTGWYKEYSFVVPYDCQPIFFLYSKPNYRSKILNLINKNQEDIRKIGEKTLELSDAYGKIGSFLNELQSIINGRQNGYGGYGGAGNNGSYGNYGSYGNSGTTYGSYGGYGGSYGSYLDFGSGSQGFNVNLLMSQSVEGLARSFNIQLPPSCWQGANSYGGYNSYGVGNQGLSQDLIGRVQCVAKSVRLEDFDMSVSRLLQQGGMIAVAQLTQRYPQLAFWINIAAAALDFIIKLTGKTPLKIVPTVTSNSEAQSTAYPYQNNFAPAQNGGNTANNPSVKISLFAEAPPSDSGFVTAYPLVINKWQANPDPEVISLPTPVLADECLHPGQNLLRSTDLINDWMSDNFTTDFKLVISSQNGFRKEFPLKKNAGLSGWELNLTREDLQSFPKINITLESEVTGKRGFNEIKSPKFNLPIPIGNSWEVETESKKAFSVGGRRKITLKNELGNCKCLETVVYKPSFGGQFIFDVNNKQNPLTFSADGKEVYFDVNTTSFVEGKGQLELRQFGGEVSNLELNLYPSPPKITELKMSRGDQSGIISGEKLEQLKSVMINGKRARITQDDDTQTNNTNSNLNGGYNNPLRTKKLITFEDAAERLISNSVSLTLELEDNRIYPYPEKFGASPARPTIVANSAREVEAVAISKVRPIESPVNKTPVVNKPPVVNKKNSQISLEGLPVFSVKTSEVMVIVQNALTDYDFKIENVQIETRIENSQISSVELPKADFEILDQNKMRLSFSINEQIERLIAGRRLQFRIRDKVRGNSDWYTLQKTFVRTPSNISVKCPAGSKGQCEVSGDGIEYISQISVNGGQSWFPELPATLDVQPKADGRKFAMIPYLANKKLLQIKLGDFPSATGLTVNQNNNQNRTKGRK